jgi:molybdopterin synthase sulfur carrier subunit
MRVKVKFFAAPREAMGKGEVQQQLPPGSTVRELIDLLIEEYPVLRPYISYMNVAVNRKYVGLQTELQEGDEVACVPPVGGG